MAEAQNDLLKHAAAATYKRIDDNHGRASPQAKRILRLVRANLFDPGFNVERVRRTLGLRSNDATTRFRREVGESIKRYIVSRRLEVACRLLLQTTLSTQEIACLVGWRAFKSFSHTFNKRLGTRPRAYRASGGKLSRGVAPSPKEKVAALSSTTVLEDGGPRFVAAMATVAADKHCARCDSGLHAGKVARVFEDRKAICGLCALEHAPRELVDFLFVNAPHSQPASSTERDRLTDPEQVLRGLRQQLSQNDAEAVIWALVSRYPRSAGVVRGILDFQEQERGRRLEASKDG